ncbi:MAG: hypothetical protein R2867_35225 [Caldilineaceae bacterium]
MNLQQLIRELHWLEWQMRKFEDKYGLRSSDFYAAMESGQLAEFDDMDQAAFQEFLEWQGLYKVWLKREKRYHEFLEQQPAIPQLLQQVAIAA